MERIDPLLPIALFRARENEGGSRFFRACEKCTCKRNDRRKRGSREVFGFISITCIRTRTKRHIGIVFPREIESVMYGLICIDSLLNSFLFLSLSSRELASHAMQLTLVAALELITRGCNKRIRTRRSLSKDLYSGHRMTRSNYR